MIMLHEGNMDTKHLAWKMSQDSRTQNLNN